MKKTTAKKKAPTKRPAKKSQRPQRKVAVVPAIEDLDDLVHDEHNPRHIDDEAKAGLRASIEQFGDLSGITYNLQENRLVTGHQRITQLRERFGVLKIRQVDDDSGVIETEAGDFHVRFVRWSKARHRAASVAANNGKIQGTFDDSLTEYLSVVADDIQQEMPGAFDELRLMELMLAGDIGGDAKELTEVEPQTDKADELAEKWGTAAGQLWIVDGKQSHRLLCGDSTNEQDVAKLLDGAEPFIMVTDPPYGVDYDPQWRNRAGIKTSRTGAIENDDRADWSDAVVLFPGDVAYLWYSDRKILESATMVHSIGFEIRAQIIWVKQQFAFGRGSYHFQHEPCYYAVRKSRKSKWTGDRKQSTVWQINNPLKSGEEATVHGSQKPLECMARPIRNHGGKDDHVYDPFLGSGTTMLAAEQLGRRCFGMEISPKYVAVILQRMTDAGCKCRQGA